MNRLALKWCLGLLVGSVAAFLNAAALPADPAAATAPASWHQLKPGEFPPLGSENRVAGELLEVDFIHRTGQFRVNGTGDLLNFRLTPYAVISYLNADADLRDLPLSNRYFFFLYQDAKGAFSQVAAIRDKFSMLAAEGVNYRLESMKLDAGKLVVSEQKLSGNSAEQIELPVSAKTRVWKDGTQIKLADLVIGDALLVNYGTGPHGDSRFCTDVWAGIETQRLATEQQRRKHHAFLKFRGLPAWIDSVEGKKMRVTLFGDPAGMRAFFKEEEIDPAKWVAEGRGVKAVAANEELRTCNPAVDGQGGKLLEVESVPVDNFGCAGVRWIIEPSRMLEGFRKDRIVRLFKEGWPVQEMPFGESLYSEAPGVGSEYEANPFRTDFAKEELPWYQPKPGEFPPKMSEHRVAGELVKLDMVQRSGQFKKDGTAELVNFTLPPYGSVMYHNAELVSPGLPQGMRCLFYLHPDEAGAFTVASVVMDEFTELASNKLSYRIEEIDIEAGKIVVARQMAPEKNGKEEMGRPCGRLELAVDDTASVWKNGGPIKLGALAVGDELLVNRSGRTGKDRGHCLEIWAGAESIKLAAETVRSETGAYLKRHGLPAWIESVDGKKLTIVFFAGNRKDFASVLDGDPDGKSVWVRLADDKLSTGDASATKMACRGHFPEGNTGGTHGSSGVRWEIEPEVLPEGFSRGRVIRVFKESWITKDSVSK